MILLATLACQVKLPMLIQIDSVMKTATCSKMGPDDTIVIVAGANRHSILIDGQAKNPGLRPFLRECIARSYGQVQWLHELPGMASDPDSEGWAEGICTLPSSLIHRGLGIDTSRTGPPHVITTVHAGSAADRNGGIFTGDTITHVDLLPTNAMTHTELHLAM